MKILLDHTAKCGGSFLRSTFARFFEEEKICYNYKQTPGGREVFEGDVEKYDFICGHYTYNHPNGTLINFDKVKNWIKIKNFRHPVDWVRSKYFFGLEILLYNKKFIEDHHTQETYQKLYEPHVFGPKFFIQNIYSTSGSIFNHFPDLRIFKDPEYLKNTYDYIVDTKDNTSFSEYFIKKYKPTEKREEKLHYNDTWRSKKYHEYFHEQIFDIMNLIEPDIEIYNKVTEIAWKGEGS